MRRALGLRSDGPAPDGHHPPPINNGLHPPRRRFVHDGEVPVTVVRREHHHDGETGTNQLEAARQAIRSQAAAKERAERALEDAHVTIRDLQTKLGHERLGKVEALDAVRRAEADRQTIQQSMQSVQAELAAERLARRAAEEKLRTVEVERQVAERRLQEMQAGTGRAKPAAPRKSMEPRSLVQAVTTEPVDGVVKRPRGRPRKVVVEQVSDIVEWWKPGWQKKFR